VWPGLLAGFWKQCDGNDAKARRRIAQFSRRATRRTPS
jgi:hypothetical protein